MKFCMILWPAFRMSWKHTSYHEEIFKVPSCKLVYTFLQWYNVSCFRSVLLLLLLCSNVFLKSYVKLIYAMETNQILYILTCTKIIMHSASLYMVFPFNHQFCDLFVMLGSKNYFPWISMIIWSLVSKYQESRNKVLVNKK